MIPQTNPKANYLAHRAAIDAAIARVLEGGWFILGQELKAFEGEFAAYFGARHAIGVGNGTDAIELALRGCGVGPGHVVFTVSHTAVATVVGVERSGATPVLVDIDPDTCTMDPNSLEEAIRKVQRRAVPVDGVAKAIVPVHLYGHPADLGAIMDLAQRHDLIVIEDCAQSHGATFGGRKLGSFGNAAAFSFYPTKNLGALGDGGAVVTSDEVVARQVRMLREYGWRERYVSDIPGVNSRLDELHAAMLRAKLPHLDADNAKRQAIARQYDSMLDPQAFKLPRTKSGCTHVFHQYVIRTSQRDALREHLKAQGVGTLIHYPAPVHLQPAYRDRLCPVVELSNTEYAAAEVLSLPMFPELGSAEAKAVGAGLRAWTPIKAAAR